MSLSCMSLPPEKKKSVLSLCQVLSLVFLIVHSALKFLRGAYTVPLAGDCATSSQSSPVPAPGWLVSVGGLVAVGVKVLVGIKKITVAVGVCVSVGVKVGGNVAVNVSAGGGSTRAVWVCAAPAVATTIVCMRPGSVVGFGATGPGRPGTAHANMTGSTESRNTIFLMECVFMFASQSYLAVKTNWMEQKLVLPTLRDQRML